jgi:hypothetical protein
VAENGTERRSEERRAASGEVLLAELDFAATEFRGELIDLSKSGFRVRHRQKRLSTGQHVRFTLPSRSGEARVMWTRILGENAESGFLIL